MKKKLDKINNLTLKHINRLRLDLKALAKDGYDEGERSAKQILSNVGLSRNLIALNSEEVFEDFMGNKISLAQVMITSYSEVYTDVELFSVDENRKHFYTTETEFLQQEHQEYLRNIEQYFMDNYQIEIHMKPPFLIHKDYKVETLDVPIK